MNIGNLRGVQFRATWWRWVCLSVWLGVCAPAMISGARADWNAIPEGQFELTQSADRHRLLAHQADLFDVLTALAGATDAEFTVDPALRGHVVTLDSTAESVEDLARALAANYALVYQRDGDDLVVKEAHFTMAGRQSGDAAAAAGVEPRADTGAEVTEPAGRGTVGRAAATRDPRTPADLGLLSNSSRPVHELTSRSGPPSLILASAIIDTEALQRDGLGLNIPARFRAPADAEYQIVQFDGPLSAEVKAEIESRGGRVAHYVPKNAYAVHLPPSERDRVLSMPGILHVEPYHPYFKMNREILSYLGGIPDAQAAEIATSGEYNVMLFNGIDGETVLADYGVEILHTQRSQDREVVTVKADPSVLSRLIAEDGVQWVEPRPQLKTMNDLGEERVRVSLLKRMHPSLDGSGVVVGVTDSGADVTHPGYSINPNLPTALNVNSRIAEYFANPGGPTSDGIIGDTDGHGTHVSGSILGNGARSSMTAVSVPGSGLAPYDPFQFAGMAPAATMVMIEDFNSYTFEEQAQLTYNNGARLSNNSWGADAFPYNAFSAVWDALVQDAVPTEAGNQELIAFFAAGNAGGGAPDGVTATAGTIGSPGNAKNVITVGAIEQPRRADNRPGGLDFLPENDSDWQIAEFSSRGPVTTTDFRTKPDIVAPGTYVISMQSQDLDPSWDEFSDPTTIERDLRNNNVDTGPFYAFTSGTSMATPITTGAGALVYQYLTETLDMATPSVALMKAMLVAGARNVNPYVYQHPSGGAAPAIVHQGWGRVDVVKSVEGTRIHATDEVILLDQGDTNPVDTGEEYSFPITIGKNDGGLKIVLAWSDAPGTPGNAVALVNDLDLILDTGNGSGYHGNVFGFDGLNSEFFDPIFDNSALADPVNNVEVISAGDLPAGEYSIRVLGQNVPQGPQRFVLVILKGQAIEGPNYGINPDMDLDDNDQPVVVFEQLDAGGFEQIFLTRWHGSVPVDERPLSSWSKMEDQWFGESGSLTGTGISQTVDPSVNPAVAVDGQNIFVVWEQETSQTGMPTSIYFRTFDGTQWKELGASARGQGISQNTEFDALLPVVAVASDGRPIVAWQQNRTFGSWVHLLKWNGTAWVGLGTSAIGVPGSTLSGRPDLAVDSQGRVVVVWEEYTSNKIRVRRWNGSTWESFSDLGYSPNAQQPDVAIGPGDQIFVAYQQFPDFLLGQQFTQAYVARNVGTGWTGMLGSYTHPGISGSTNTTMTPITPKIDINDDGRIMVAWQQTVFTTNSIIVKEPGDFGWVGVSGAGEAPGVANLGGFSEGPVIKVDSLGTPVVTYEVFQTNRPNEAVSYTLVRDRQPPTFNGLGTAIGSGGSAVDLSWQAAIDESEPITYTIYRSVNSFPCGSTPSCNVGAVFGNPIGTTTETTFRVTGLQDGRVYCFGVRATDAAGLQDANQVIRTAGPVSGTGDPDNDCLPNAIELAIGTDVCLRDTDGDGMWDGWEYAFSTLNPNFTGAYGMDPLDNGVDRVNTVAPNDGDPLQLPEEDIDGDGASNLEEFLWWLNYTGGNCDIVGTSPDPTNPDSDGDGIPDGWEILNGLNPMDPSDANDDNDNDGLTNLQEYLSGGDPFNPDSDGDGIPDGEEFTMGTAVNKADTDGDGLDDGFEIYVLGTDPLNWDSNGNGLSDGDAYQLGHLDPSAPFDGYNYLARWDFETPESQEGWTHRAPNPAFPFDLWHLSTADPEPAQSGDGVLEVKERSVTTAWRVANDPTRSNPLATYLLVNQNVTQPINVELTSPPVDASATTTLFAEWNEWVETEQGQDLTRVFAIADGDLIATPITTTVSGSTGGWVHRVADMSGFVGRTGVRLRFVFQTLNGVNQNFRGWYVDDVALYEGVTVRGWVRDVDGRPVDEAVISFIGQGGITNLLHGHTIVAPGKLFAQTQSTTDGSFLVSGLPQGQYYVKANSPVHKAEFWNGPLMNGPYTFGAMLNPGVFSRERVGPQGVLDLTSTAAAGEVHFELERGSSRACLGVTADSIYPIQLNGRIARVWNGINTPAGAALVDYTTAVGETLANRMPDWLDNPVMPDLLCDLEPGRHLPYAIGTGTLYPLPFVTLREGETTLVGISTAQAVGRLFVEARDGGNYPVVVDGQATGFSTPANIPIAAGAHMVQIVLPAGMTKFTPIKEVEVPIGGRARATFTQNDISGPSGRIQVRAVDIFGTPITNATILVDGYGLTTNDVAEGSSVTTPATVVGMMTGGVHTVQVQLDGYKNPAFRAIRTGANSTASASFTLYQADRDYDGVGDRAEITGYEDIFLYHRDEDPDEDGLSNLQEFNLFFSHGITLNIFTNDTDGDGLLDGEEVGYDGVPGQLAFSTLWADAPDQTPTVYVQFKGRFLDGIDFFENGHYVASIDGDLFDAAVLRHSTLVPPTTETVATILDLIPNSGEHLRVSPSHPRIARIFSDTLPHEVDSDGDGMWDGWEVMFGPDYVSPAGISANLDPLTFGRMHEDPDGDGLTNLEEFLGADGIPNLDDWLDPTNPDTDGDGMPDGWEIQHGFDPRDPSDAALDADGDGLSNLGEYLFGTLPRVADTDGDFLPDGAEIEFGSDPLNPDTDGDGLLDGREVWDWNMDGVFDGGFLNVLPGGDFDGDGLFDGPQDWDSDGDGMPDGFEVLDPSFGMPYTNVPDDCRMDPMNPNDADLDCDGDGLTNLEEYLVKNELIGNPPVSFDPSLAAPTLAPFTRWLYSTNPYDPDTDGDGFPDGYEVWFGLHPQDPFPNTAGTNRTFGLGIFLATGDPDGDGLWNQREYEIRFHLSTNANALAIQDLSTHPWNPDTDGDGLWDGEEDRVFRTNPRLQDTDGDLLPDGANIPGTVSEVESMIRTQPFTMLVTNHLDSAANDLWRLDWGAGNGLLPTWTRVPVPADMAPPPRWGASTAYIPINGFVDEILVDHRSIVWIGGRQGVTKIPDIWQYFLGSGEWVQLSNSNSGTNLVNESYALGAMSEMSTVPIFATRNTATDPVPDVTCTPRPSLGNNNFAWLYSYTGWDQFYNYFDLLSQGYLVPSDALDGLVSNIDSTDSVWEAINLTGTPPRAVFDNVQVGGLDGLPLGLGYSEERTEEDTTNTYGFDSLGAHFAFPTGTTFSADCVILNSAELRMDIERAPVNDLEWDLVLEVSSGTGLSIPTYVLADNTNPRARIEDPDNYINTTPVSYVIPAGTEGIYSVDITPSLLELLGNGAFAGTNVGVVITSVSPESAVALKDPFTLSLQFQENWQVAPVALGGQGFGEEPRWTSPTQTIRDPGANLPRKMSPAAHDYGRDIIVYFGGIQGNDILDDTIEITYAFNPAGNPTTLTRTQTNPDSSPPARYAHSLVYDAARTRIILFGGFDENHQPLNDVWAYDPGNDTWSEISIFMDNQRPPPRGGASMVYFGGSDWSRAGGIQNSQDKIVLFGGTDGEIYFNDTWVLSFEPTGFAQAVLAPDPESSVRWILAQPHGESPGPSGRAFADMVYAQNGVQVAGPDGNPPAVAAAFLYGGRTGTLPTGRDTDDDKVDDGTEFALGGAAAGRDPRVNALQEPGSSEVIPFAYKPIGTPFLVGRGTIANLEAISYVDAGGNLDINAQGHPIDWNDIGQGLTYSTTGVDAWLPQMTNLWWHRYGGEQPGDPRDVWELGVPNDTAVGLGAPPYAYRGRWVYGTNLNGNYPNNAVMDLYSPMVTLDIPQVGSPIDNLETSYYLSFYEWLDLADANDSVRIDLIRPRTEADRLARVHTSPGDPPPVVLGSRNNNHNTAGEWRHQIVPLDILGAETNVYFRFSLRSDGSRVAGGWYIDDVSIFQAAQITGVLTNEAGEGMGGVQVDLLGANFNQTVLQTTATDPLGRYKFGPLPFGNYQVSVGGNLVPIDLTPADADQRTETGLAVTIVDMQFSIYGQVTWPAIHGMRYRVEYIDDPASPSGWIPLGTVVANSVLETFTDLTAPPTDRYYRVRLLIDE